MLSLIEIRKCQHLVIMIKGSKKNLINPSFLLHSASVASQVISLNAQTRYAALLTPLCPQNVARRAPSSIPPNL